MGTRGAAVTANTVKPDLAIVFEGCPADDTVAEPYMIQTAIHKGPMLRHIDARMITHPRFQRYALDLAEELGIPVQESVRTGGSTNGAPIHLSNQGVPVIVIGIPVRYIHTHYGLAAHSDVENAAKLAARHPGADGPGHSGPLLNYFFSGKGRAAICSASFLTGTMLAVY